jgi:hypothetical protein
MYIYRGKNNGTYMSRDNLERLGNRTHYLDLEHWGNWTLYQLKGGMLPTLKIDGG